MSLVCLGEALFRFATPIGVPADRANSTDFYLGGSELNIAANYARLGGDVTWVSEVAIGPMGDLVLQKALELGVNTDWVHRSEGSIGWYFVETAHHPRPTRVLKRAASVMAEVKDFNWNFSEIFSKAKTFHTSGITCGLSETTTKLVLEALKEARAKNVLTSYDFNFRSNIWSLEEAHERQMSLLPYIDHLFCSPQELKLFFGVDYPHYFDSQRSQLDDQALNVLQEKVFEETGVRSLVLTHRSHEEKQYVLEYISKDEQLFSTPLTIHEVDRIGVGDAMAAAYLWAQTQNDLSIAEKLEVAALSGAWKYTICGDMALIKSSDLLSALREGVRGIIR